jgi:hypothetical protein
MQWRINQILLPYHPTSIQNQTSNTDSTQTTLTGVTSATLSLFDNSKSIEIKIYDKPTKIPSPSYTLPSQNLFKSIEFNPILNNYIILSNTNNVETRNNLFAITSTFPSPTPTTPSINPIVAKKNGVDVIMLYKNPTQANLVTMSDTGLITSQFNINQTNDEFVDLTTTYGLDYTYVLDSFGRIALYNASARLNGGQGVATLVAEIFLDDFFDNKSANNRKYKRICSFLRDGYYYLAISTGTEVVVIDVVGNVVTSYKPPISLLASTVGVAFDRNTSEILYLTDKYIYRSKLNMADIILNNVTSELTQALVTITDENGIQHRCFISDFDVARANNLGENIYTVSINYRI